MAGQVIGMNTAIYTQSAGSEGIGFAMPSNILINVYNMLIGPEHKVIRGSIGIQFQAAQSSAVGRMYGFANGGVLVSSVTPNGPASKAGLQSGDVIVAIDGASIKDGDELVAIISAKHPGSTVNLTYLRNGKRETATVGITDRAKLFADLDNASGDDNTPDESDVGQSKLGITVQATSPALAKQARRHRRSHRHQRQARLVRRQHQPGPGRRHHGDQSQARDRRSQLPGHRHLAQIRRGRGLRHPRPPQSGRRKQLRRRYPAVNPAKPTT